MKVLNKLDQKINEKNAACDDNSIPIDQALDLSSPRVPINTFPAERTLYVSDSFFCLLL